MTGSTATPIHLAEEIVKIVGDADSDTAQTAVAIARLLLLHREHCLINFERDAISPTG